LGLLGQGSSFVFIVVGITLVTVQARYMGRLSQKFGEGRLVYIALGLLAVGLVLLAFTPDQPEPFYIRQIAENTLRTEARAVSSANSTSSSEAVIGKICVPRPDDSHDGVWGVLWLLVVILPVSVGAGLIRPSLNSLMTKRVDPSDYGSVLGFSASFVSLA